MSGNTHEIEFRRSLCVVLEGRKHKPSQLLQVTRGSRYEVHLVPYHRGQQEVADFYFADGSIAREIAFAYFQFVEE
jgi:hypothetical protein